MSWSLLNYEQKRAILGLDGAMLYHGTIGLSPTLLFYPMAVEQKPILFQLQNLLPSLKELLRQAYNHYLMIEILFKGVHPWKLTWNPKHWWFVDVFPRPKGICSGSMLIVRGDWSLGLKQKHPVNLKMKHLIMVQDTWSVTITPRIPTTTAGPKATKMHIWQLQRLAIKWL